MEKKKKVLLCGATHGSNFGDSLFAFLFNEKINEKYDNVSIYFTKVSDYSRDYLGIEQVKLKELFSMDAMVFISGGYFGQSHEEGFKKSVFRFLNYFIYGVIMALRKKPISIIGVGAGPLNRGFLKKAAVFLFNKSQIVSVRDEESWRYMKEYGVNRDIIVTSDSAQVINDTMFKDNKVPMNESDDAKLKGKHVVLVHVPSNAKSEFKEIIIPAIKESLFNDENIGFILSHDAVIKNNFIKEIYEMFPQNRTVLYDFLDPVEFLKIINYVDTVITTKLHVGILAATFNKAIISFPLHPEKTKRYYTQIGYPEISKSLFEVNKDEAKEMIKENIYKKVELSQDIRTSSNKNFELLNEFIKSI